MLNYQKSSLLEGAALSAVAALELLDAVPLWAFIPVIIPYLALLVWGSVSICSGFYLKAICSGSTGIRSFSLTFDDGPHPVNTPAILDVLRRHGVHAAFFLTGRRAERYPELVRQIVREGHLIGGHSWSHHFFFDLFSRRRMSEELDRSEELLRGITGKRIRMFRPPYGVTNPPLGRAIRMHGYSVIGWSLRSRDTVTVDRQQLMERLKKKLRPGDIVLFHDHGMNIAEILNDFISHAGAQRFDIVPVDRLVQVSPYAAPE